MSLERSNDKLFFDMIAGLDQRFIAVAPAPLLCLSRGRPTVPLADEPTSQSSVAVEFSPGKFPGTNHPTPRVSQLDELIRSRCQGRITQVRHVAIPSENPRPRSVTKPSGSSFTRSDRRCRRRSPRLISWNFAQGSGFCASTFFCVFRTAPSIRSFRYTFSISSSFFRTLGGALVRRIPLLTESRRRAHAQWTTTPRGVRFTISSPRTVVGSGCFLICTQCWRIVLTNVHGVSTKRVAMHTVVYVY